jgi:hypothetical protein
MQTYLLAVSTGTSIGNITGIGPLGNVADTSTGTAFSLFELLVSNIIGALTVIASIWFIYQIILASISWISSNGDKQNIQTAQKRLTNSFLGLLVAVMAYSVTALIGKFLGMPGIFNVAATLNTLHP